MNHRGAGSIKGLLAADFQLWMTLLSKIQELKQKLENKNKSQYNMTKDEMRALKELKKMENIRITTSDKSGKIVISRSVSKAPFGKEIPA